MLLYVNEYKVTNEKEVEIVKEHLEEYLSKEKLIIVDHEGQPISQEGLSQLLLENVSELRLAAKSTSVMLREFKEELVSYIQNVETYIERMRENENFSDVLNGFIQVTEALLQFSSVEAFLQKSLVDQEQLNDLSTKALMRAKEGNYEYVLDLLEYELLAILYHFLDETNEVM